MADETEPSSAADAVKARRGATVSRHASTTPAPEAQTPSAAGITGDSPSGVATLTGSFVAGHSTSEDYVRTVKDAYHSHYPWGTRQPTTVLLWNAGQLVHREHYAAHGGDDAPETADAAHPVNEPGGGVGDHVSGMVSPG